MSDLKPLPQNILDQIQNVTDTWQFLSSGYNLSESFIREFADKVHWQRICKHQSLSESFTIEMQLRGYL